MSGSRKHLNKVRDPAHMQGVPGCALAYMIHCFGIPPEDQLNEAETPFAYLPCSVDALMSMPC